LKSPSGVIKNAAIGKGSVLIFYTFIWSWLATEKAKVKTAADWIRVKLFEKGVSAAH